MLGKLIKAPHMRGFYFGAPMKYRESNKDRELRKWFINDDTHVHLRRVKVSQGQIRGISDLNLPINFPITAIAGKNGSGKSTILALACCAYHNRKEGFKRSNRRQSYYTFADFFIQHSEEIPPQGISIQYDFAHNNWRKTEQFPEGKGIGTQFRNKKKAGKWNEYASRVKRNCVFIGIERIVPHSEKSQSKSYNRYFLTTEPNGWEDKVKDIVGHILNKKYEEFRLVSHSKYRLPIAKSGGIIFSGFNMGAGENALFEIFSTIFSCPEGAIFVIDEIELGLHIEAQKKFIKALKEVCSDRRAQIICTTHSKEVFECLPEEARIFIEKINNKTITTIGASSEYAFSKLSSEKLTEVDILVEDDVAKGLLSSVLPSKLRSRISIEIIGSATALCVQLAALHNREENNKSLIIFDGDQKPKEKHNKKHTHKVSEKNDLDFDTWFSSRTEYLPGEAWPELWILQRCQENLENLSKITNTEPDHLSDVIEYGIGAGKHNEFHEVAKHLGITREQALYMFCTNISQCHNATFNPIIQKISTILSH
jgi:predicted ATP-dependent endonuclease of OLD family